MNSMSGLGDPKFLVDAMLGKLGQWLRILGYDAEAVPDNRRGDLLERSILETRVLLTREAKLEGANAHKVIYLNTGEWDKQLLQIWHSLNLPPVSPIKLFSRCTACNIPLKEAHKESLATESVPPKVYSYQNKFFQCPRCRKLYWLGTHLANTIERLKSIGIPMVSE